ncbi:MAG: IS982 family transposase [Candidatus Saccharimonadales bacterium]
MELVKLFYLIDEFCMEYEPHWQRSLVESGVRQRRRTSRLSLSEILTIIVFFHTSGYRMFKWYYERELLGTGFVASCFPQAVSYNQFLELMSASLVPLGHCLLWLCSLSARTGIQFIDSTSIVVCSNLRINRHKVFRGSAARGRTSEGWFFGFKLHLIVNDRDELLALRITPGNVSDVDAELVTGMAEGIQGKLFGDKGYISKEVFERLWKQGLRLVTNIRSNMKQRLLPLQDKLMLRKRFIIETVNDHLKNNEQIEHSRHRSFANFSANLLAGLIAYQLQPKKPSIRVPRMLLLEA